MTRARLLLLVAAGGLARASQPHYEGIDLKDLVSRSPVIVIAHASGPSLDLQIPITPKGKRADAKKWPAFVRSRSRWMVDEVLRGPPSLAQHELLVDRAEWQTHFNEHRRGWVDHMLESVPYQSYQPAAPTDGGAVSASRILFLFSDRGDYAFVVEGALETVDHRAQILELIPKR